MPLSSSSLLLCITNHFWREEGPTFSNNQDLQAGLTLTMSESDGVFLKETASSKPATLIYNSFKLTIWPNPKSPIIILFFEENKVTLCFIRRLIVYLCSLFTLPIACTPSNSGSPFAFWIQSVIIKRFSVAPLDLFHFTKTSFHFHLLKKQMNIFIFFLVFVYKDIFRENKYHVGSSRTIFPFMDLFT